MLAYRKTFSVLCTWAGSNSQAAKNKSLREVECPHLSPGWGQCPGKAQKRGIVGNIYNRKAQLQLSEMRVALCQ